jgi:hypothetical protein
MKVTSMDWNRKHYGVKFFYSVSKKGLDRKVDRWKFTQNGRRNHKLTVEEVQTMEFQFGPMKSWVYYAAAMLYKTEWVE